METSMGLAHVWNEGDWVTRTVALLLLGMSLASWMVIVIKALDLRRHRAQAQQVESFWHSNDFADGLNKLGDDEGNPFRQLALQGREATRHVLHQDGQNKPQLHDSLDVSDWVTRALRNTIDDFTARLQGGLAVLIISLALGTPILGLLGAVGAALTLGLRGGGMLLALLVLPLFVPVLIFGAGAVEAELSGTGAVAHLLLLGGGLAGALALAPVACAAALRISTD